LTVTVTGRRVLGVMLVIFGVIWLLQGVGWLAGGLLGGEPAWAALGVGLLAAGGWILMRSTRR
jgi:hypothetical protein